MNIGSFVDLTHLNSKPRMLPAITKAGDYLREVGTSLVFIKDSFGNPSLPYPALVR